MALRPVAAPPPPALPRALELALLPLASLLVLAAAPGYLPGGASYGDDASSHLAVAVELARHLRAGDLDLWCPTFCLGFPAGYYYGPLPHLLLAGLLALLGSWVAPVLLYKATLLVGLAALPWAVAAGARRLGLTPTAARLAGVFALTVSSVLSFGWALESFLRHGLFAQLPGFLLLPLTLAAVLRFIGSGQKLWLALLLHTLLVLCHPFTGQIVALAAGLAALLHVLGPMPAPGAADPASDREAARQPPRRLHSLPLGRLLLLGLLVAATTACWWGPMLAAWSYFGGWPAGKPAQWDGPGLARLLGALLGGTLLDHGRLPSMSLAAAVGLAGWCWLGLKRRSSAALPLLGLGLAALLLAAGRTTFGDWIDRLPLHRHMELSRYLVPLQLVLVLAAGAGLAAVLRFVSEQAARLAASRGPLFARAAGQASALLLLLLLLGLPLLERCLALPGLFVTSTRYFGGEEQARRAEELMADLGRGQPGRILAHGATGLGTHFWMGLPAALSGRPMLFSYGAGYQDAAGAGVIEELTPLLSGESARAALAAFGVRFVLAQEDKLRADLAPVRAQVGKVVLQDLGPALPFRLGRAVGTLCAPPTGRRAAVRAWLGTGLPAAGGLLLLDGGCAATATEAGLVEAQDAAALHRWLASIPLPTPAAGRVVEWLERPSEWRASVRGASAGELLVLDQGVHPGWQVTLDGQPAPRLEVAPAFNAVALPPGDHEVTFRFRRPAWAWPLWGALPLFVILLGLAERRPGLGQGRHAPADHGEH